MSARALQESLVELRLAEVAERHVELRRRLVEALRAADASFDMMNDDWATVPARTEAELVAAAPHLLLAWCDDLDGTSLFLVPVDAPGPGARLVRDLRELHGACFADGSDLTPAGLGAALRVLAAIGRQPAARLHAGWRAEIDHAGGGSAVGIKGPDDLVPYERTLAPHALSQPASFVHRIVEVSAIRKAS